MTIYILKVYPTAHKWEPDARVVGYFTSKTALLRTIRRFKKSWGVYDELGFARALDLGHFYHALNCCTERGAIEEVYANERQISREDVDTYADD